MSKNSAKIGDIMMAPLGAVGNRKTKVRVVDMKNGAVKVEYVEKVIRNELGNTPFNIDIELLEPVAVIKKGDRIVPDYWIAQNMKKFPDWINSVFLDYRVSEKVKNKAEFTTYQKFIRDYLQASSPYRGLLLYHGLGSGKTCSSIIIAESMEKNVIVLSPATLRSNYVTALKEDPICGVPAYKNNKNLIDEKYTFISYNAPNTIEQLDKISSLDNHTIVIDEVHNLISMIVSQSKKGPEIYRRLMEAKNVKIVALSGTPIINYPFEIAILANILRGYIEVSSFYLKTAKTLEVNILRGRISELDGVDYVDANQRNIGVYFHKPSYEAGFDSMVKRVLDTGAKIGGKLEYIGTTRYSLFPDNEDEFREYFIEETSEGEVLKNMSLLKRRLLGLISYYRGGKAQFYPTVNPVIFEEIPMSNYQFSEYSRVRDVERDKEKAGAVQKMLGKVTSSKSKNGAMKKVSSLFKVFSRQYSNFVFPENIERPFVRKFIQDAERKKLEKKSKKNSSALAELEDLEKENKRMNDGNLTIKDKEQIERALKALASDKDKYLKTDLKKYSPKMAKMLENIMVSPGLVLVYSSFRSLEGIGIFELVLQANGWERFDVDNPNKKSDKPKYGIYSGVEDDDEKEKLISIFRSKENKNGEKVKLLMISGAGAEGLDLKNIRQIHIMDPYWHEVRISQVIGRGNRFMSHIDLPEKDRTIDVYRYISKLSGEQVKNYEEKLSTDEYIYDIAMKKMRITEDIKKTMKEIAVDCVLNAIDNEKDIKCFSFGLDASGIAYKADIKQDMVFGKTEIGTREVTKSLEAMFLDDNNNLIWADKKKRKLCYFNNRECKSPLEKAPKNVRKVGVDMITLEVFDVDGVGLIKLGVVDKNGKLV